MFQLILGGVHFEHTIVNMNCSACRYTLRKPSIVYIHRDQSLVRWLKNISGLRSVSTLHQLLMNTFVFI